MTEATRKAAGNLLAAFTCLVWGVTFVSSKRLLAVMSPLQLLFCRFLLGYLLLWVIHPHRLHVRSGRDVLDFAGAGFFGVFLYYFLENSSLTYTYASNTSVIVSTAPMFTILICSVAFRTPLKMKYLAGFLISICGIVLISFNGSQVLHLNPKGDVMALGAAVMWGFYSLFTTRVTRGGYGMLPATRVMFLIALIGILVVNLFEPAPWRFGELVRWPFIGHLLFLGWLASGICFVTWNLAMKYAGVVNASFYIYASPVVTLVASSLFLQERLTPLSLLGAVLAIGGMVVSGWKER